MTGPLPTRSPLASYVDRLMVAAIVAEHWRTALAEWGDQACAHPLSLVLSAVDGQTDPEALGIDDDHPDAERIRQVLR